VVRSAGNGEEQRDEDFRAKRQQAKEQLQALLVALDEIPDGGWIHNVVHLDELQQLLEVENPDAGQLKSAYDYLRHRYDASVQPHIDQLRATVDELRGWAALKSAGVNEQELEKNLAVIHARIEAPLAPLTPEQAEELRSAVAWLAQWRRLDVQLEDANRKISQPNQMMILSAAYMKGMASREIVKSVSINESQGDAQVTGQGDIHILPALDLIPNQTRGQLQIHVDGQGVVPIMAVSKPATVYANSHISFSGDQILYVTPTGIETPAPSITADSNTCLRCVAMSTKCRMLKLLLHRLVERIASRKLSESDVQAAQKAQQEIESEVVTNSLALATQMHDLLERFFFRTFGARDVQPNVRVQSTEKQLIWSAQYQSPWQLGALSPPPLPAEPVAVLMQFHESAFNNAGAALGGERMGEPEFQEVVFGMFRLQPPDDSWQKSGRIPAALHLSDFDPLEIHLRDGRIFVKLSIEAFEYGGQRFDGRSQIEATYEPHFTREGVTIERIGDTQIHTENAANMELLEKAVSRFFLSHAEARLNPNPRRGNKLAVNYFQVDNGWLSFGLSPTPPSTPVSTLASTGPQE